MSTVIRSPQHQLLAPSAVLAALLALACGAEHRPKSGQVLADCVGSPRTTSKRVVRLTEHQLFNAYGSLFGEPAASAITASEMAPSLAEREFPPIASDIGVSDRFFGLYDRLAQAAMAYVAANSDTMTPCGSTPADAQCVKDYLLSLAETAFRRPLTAAERTAIAEHFWSSMSDAGGSTADALAFGVYGVLSSPSFLYRTEFGADVAVDGPLTPYEIATTLSLFLTDRPPDARLLAAAAGSRLSTPEQIRAQATRLLATPEARANLEMALVKYFSLTRAPTVILNPEATPGLIVTRGLESAIYHESELFMRNLLWSSPLTTLLTARTTWTNAAVATQVYGVAEPAQTDADGFGLVELPADRAGLSTLSTFLLATARSNDASPVARGLAVNGSILCQVNPPFPQVVNPNTGALEPDPDVAAAIAGLASESERVKAEYRATTPKCAGCHGAFDPFGMVLEPYDAVGRFRTTDLEGRTIDSSWTTTTLPASVGGANVATAAEAAQVLAASGALERCMAMNFINYALTEVSRGGANNVNLNAGPQTGSCAVQAVVERFTGGDETLSSLLSEIAASETLTVRKKAP